MSIKQKETVYPTKFEIIKFSFFIMTSVMAVIFSLTLMVVLGLGSASIGIENMHAWFLNNDISLITWMGESAVKTIIHTTSGLSITFIILVEWMKYDKRKQLS